jgi:hypothetical protein
MDEQKEKADDIKWHPAFVQGIRASLYRYRDVLTFESEHKLNREPLSIDVIIKKNRDVVIDNIIATIFRWHNIFEYKSPKDTLTYWDYYKGLSYGGLYMDELHLSIADWTLSFVSSSYPRNVIERLGKERRFVVDKIADGVYKVVGEVVPTQFIVTKSLSASDAFFLRNLNDNVGLEDLLLIKKQDIPYHELSAYMDVVFKSNIRQLEEAMKMSISLEEWLLARDSPVMRRVKQEARQEAIQEVRQEIKQEVKQEVRQEVKQETARRALLEGIPPLTVQRIYDLDAETVRSLL